MSGGARFASRKALWCFVVTVLFVGAPLSAEGQTATLTAVGQAALTSPGATATATVTLEGSLAIDGYSFGLAHDPTVLGLAVGGVVLGAAYPTNPPEFVSIDIFAGGFTVGVVHDVGDPVLVAPPPLAALAVHEVIAVTYSVLPTTTANSTTLDFTNTLGTPPVQLSVGMGTSFVEPPTVVSGTLSILRPFIRGDVNGNGQVTISDVIFLLTRLFLTPTTPFDCREAANVNGDVAGGVNISDAIFLLAFLFDLGSAPPPPFDPPNCGLPPAPPVNTCDVFNNCP